MKTALLHYWLTAMRGGEKVLAELCRLYPDADVYTHAALPEKLDPAITAHPIHESLIASLPFGRSHCQSYLPLMPFAQKLWDFSSYDLLISSESGPVKGIRKPAGCRHICYCHTPMRYLWDMYELYYANAGLPGKAAMKLFRKPLQKYDLRSAECVDRFVANSHFVAERIKRIYGRDAEVIYPPVDTAFFSQSEPQERSGFLMVGQLVCYKRPDLAVKLFSRLPQYTLTVVGDGPMKRELQQKATPNVRFVSCREKKALRDLYSRSKALIFPGIEDFGIVPVEAQAAGTPVIALQAGGALETVQENVTGLFFRQQTEEALAGAIEEFLSRSWSEEACRQQAKRFSNEEFRKQFKELAGKII